jgi:hypothetical protein
MGLRKSEHPGQLPCDRRIERVSAVVQKVSERHQVAQIGPVDKCPVGFPGATVTFPNGTQIIVGVDLDHPDELFEVVRCSLPEEMALEEFERGLRGGFTGLTRLTDAEVLQVVARYSLLRVN